MLEDFLNWFQTNGGTFDSDALGFTAFPESEGGRGVVAQVDIPEGQTLFSIPRSLTLSTRTSELPALFGAEAWKRHKLDQGWPGLILCMMWESASGTSSRWAEYFNILPDRFDTPMFWSAEELSELLGTSVVEKLGRAEAEASYHEILLPAVQSRPDLFLASDMERHYSLEIFHLMGSRILSRSFNVEKWESSEEDHDDGHEEEKSNEHGHGGDRKNAMEVDSENPEREGKDERDEAENEEARGGPEEEEEEENEDSGDIAMVPMADMLNARYGTENAKLFYEEHMLKMVSTRPIKQGEQVWNTYGDLPNSELLRRYGHTDLLPLSENRLGNPGDVVELRADIIVSVLSKRTLSPSSASKQERIEWWLEEGGDDVFELDTAMEIPAVLVSFIRLLLLDEKEWEKTQEKGKPPKAKPDEEILGILKQILEHRLQAYSTDIKTDEELLGSQLSLNKRNAVIVRVGEKRILHEVLSKVEGSLQAMGVAGQKRKGNQDDSSSKSKAKRAKK